MSIKKLVVIFFAFLFIFVVIGISSHKFVQISIEEEVLSTPENKEQNGPLQNNDNEQLNVVEDKEYQIFELSELLSKGKKLEALRMVQALSNAGKSGFSILNTSTRPSVTAFA